MFTRRRGEIGKKWIIKCRKAGQVFPLTDAREVFIELTGNRQRFKCAIDSAALGIVSYTNDADDIAVGRHDFVILINTNLATSFKSKNVHQILIES